MGFQKKLWCALLITGLGALLLFVLDIIVTGLPPILFLGAAGFMLSCISIWMLKRCYKAEPLAANALWHLSIRDFWALTFFEALLLFIFEATIPEMFFKVGIPFALTLAAASIPGALLASYKGINGPMARPIYAGGFAMLLMGGLITGGLLILLSLVSIGERRIPLETMIEILGLRGVPADDVDEWALVLFRLGIGSVVTGGLTCWLTAPAKTKNPD